MSAILLFATFLILGLLLRTIVSFAAIVLHASLLAEFLNFLPPLMVDCLIVADHRREQFLQLTFEDTITEIVPLQFQQLLNFPV